MTHHHNHDHECHGRHDHQSHVPSFSLGVAVGAAAALLLTPEDGKHNRARAKRKLEELLGKAPEEMVDSIKDVTQNVLDDIQNAAERGVRKASGRKKK
jgi:gas vesicle protein